MSAVVIDFRHAKARRIALAKAARVRELAEELAAYLPGEARVIMACLYIDKGWATQSEIKLALQALGEEL